jgi:hypothetical protein
VSDRLVAVMRRAISCLECEGRRKYGDLIEDLEREVSQLERRKTMRNRAHERRPAVEGEKFKWPIRGPEAEAAGTDEIEMVVRAKAPGDDGRWWCISCGAQCEHDLDKDMHCQKGGKRGFGRRKLTLELGDHRAAHVLAWRNFQTGHVEVP